eukprot:3286941-Amphidinium_carterae.1
MSRSTLGMEALPTFASAAVRSGKCETFPPLAYSIEATSAFELLYGPCQPCAGASGAQALTNLQLGCCRRYTNNSLRRTFVRNIGTGQTHIPGQEVTGL